MISLTVDNVFADRWPDWDESICHEFYVFRDGDTVLYVGKSISVEDRLREHIGLRGRIGIHIDDVGNLIHHKLPESLEWQIDLFTLDDCRGFLDILGDIEDCLPLDYQRMVETELIKHFKPILNVSNNPITDKETAKKYRYIPDGLLEAHREIFDD